MNLPNGSREGNQSSLVKFTIFFQVSSPRFSASERSTCFFEIRPLYSFKICCLPPVSQHFFKIYCLTPVSLTPVSRHKSAAKNLLGKAAREATLAPDESDCRNH